jgi:hypothetical protein
MEAYEYVGNLHVHTVYSDGEGTHEEVAQAGLEAGLDFLVVTDHNIWVGGLDGYRTLGGDRLLLLVGEEVHDQTRHPQKNHLLIYEARREFAPHAKDPQHLMRAIGEAGALAFVAHPVDPAAPAFGEPDLSWVDWDISGLTGLEIWNFMSEFKSLLKSFPRALYYAYRPERVARAPFPEALRRWDQLLARGQKLAAIGGADAHAFRYHKGPLRRTLFPYAFHFRSVLTHVLTSQPLVGETEVDRRILFQAIRKGQCYVANDLISPAHGFRYSAATDHGTVLMGGEARGRFGVTLQIRLPSRAQVHLYRDGQPLGVWNQSDTVVYTATETGAYRMEAHLAFGGELRGWIYSNPIYVFS